VTENMFGDILSDLGAALVGGMGMAPSADIGDKYAVFQPSHGSPAQGLQASPQPGPIPVVPVRNAAPFAAPRPSAPAIAPPAIAPPAVAPSPPAPRPTSPIVIALLVVIAAAGAAITVYFVLPLLT